MASLSDYLGLVSSWLSKGPKFIAELTVLMQSMVDAQTTINDLPDDFDLDAAEGAQLDVVGLWAGRSRLIETPLSSVYFSFDTINLGFDEGSWQGGFDPEEGLTALDDTTYRQLLRAKIGANSWDGTIPSAQRILTNVFPDPATGLLLSDGNANLVSIGGSLVGFGVPPSAATTTLVFIQDNQDMTMLLCVAGVWPSAVMQAIISGGYIPLKPEGVAQLVQFTSVSGTPLFGFDMEANIVSGFDTGSWGITYVQPPDAGLGEFQLDYSLLDS